MKIIIEEKASKDEEDTIIIRCDTLDDSIMKLIHQLKSKDELLIGTANEKIARILGMVGALSIVRFRTAIKDSRDTVYIFWTVVVGLTCGVGDYITAGIGSAIVFLILLVLGRIKNESRMLLIVRGARSTDKRIMSIVSEYFSRRIDLRVENTTEQTVELIYEIPLKIFEKASNRAESIADCLYEIEHVEYVNVVAQDDDISN